MAIKDFFIGIKNIFIYWKVVYQTRDYSFIYILDMMKFQLNRLKKNFEKNEPNDVKTIKELERVIELINNFLDANFDERILQPDNWTKFFESHNEKEIREIVRKINKLESDENKELFDTIRDNWQNWEF